MTVVCGKTSGGSVSSWILVSCQLHSVTQGGPLVEDSAEGLREVEDYEVEGLACQPLVESGTLLILRELTTCVGSYGVVVLKLPIQTEIWQNMCIMGNQTRANLLAIEGSWIVDTGFLPRNVEYTTRSSTQHI